MKQAMIFAAGLGTRLKPLTDTMPKALVKVGGQPLLWHVIQKLKAAGYEFLVVNVHHGLLETGGGIKKALPLFDPSEPILIHNVDILSNLDLSKTTDFGTAVKSVESVVVVSQRKTKRYLQFDDDMRLIGWKNIETGEVKGREGRPLAFSGIHIFHPSLAPLMEDWPDRFPIMDFYLKVCADHVIRGFEAPNLHLLDVGKLDTLEQANIFIETNMNNVNNIIHE